VPFCLPQIPHGVACDQTQSFVVKLVTEQWHSPMFTLTIWRQNADCFI